MPELPGDRGSAPRPRRAGACDPVERAGPAHVATLKTFDPPLRALEGRRLAGARRRGKHLLFPTDDGELVLHVHLMSAGRLATRRGGQARRRRRPPSGSSSQSGRPARPDRGRREEARAGRRLLARRPSRRSSRTSGRTHSGIGADRLGEILAAESRRLHPLLRDQRALAGIGRAWSNEILTPRPALALRALDRARRRTRSSASPKPIDDELARGLELRERGVARREDLPGAQPARTAVPAVRDADRARSTSRSTRSTTAPSCQTGGRVLKDRRLSRLLR